MGALSSQLGRQRGRERGRREQNPVCLGLSVSRSRVVGSASLFCTRITTCYPDRVATGPHFVPGSPHSVSASLLRWRAVPLQVSLERLSYKHGFVCDRCTSLGAPILYGRGGMGTTKPLQSTPNETSIVSQIRIHSHTNAQPRILNVHDPA